MEKTEWFPKNTRPINIGVYETKSPVMGEEEGWMRYWDGGQWRAGIHKTCGAWHKKARNALSAYVQDCHWRGVTEESKGGE